jgi:hypothetical protein
VAAAVAVVAAAEAAGKQLKVAGRSRLRLAGMSQFFFVFARDRGIRSWHRWRVPSNSSVIKGGFDQPMIRKSVRA